MMMQQCIVGTNKVHGMDTISFSPNINLLHWILHNSCMFLHPGLNLNTGFVQSGEGLHI
jgi:hypothetical protein